MTAAFFSQLATVRLHAIDAFKSRHLHWRCLGYALAVAAPLTGLILLMLANWYQIPQSQPLTVLLWPALLLFLLLGSVFTALRVQHCRSQRDAQNTQARLQQTIEQQQHELSEQRECMQQLLQTQQQLIATAGKPMAKVNDQVSEAALSIIGQISQLDDRAANLVSYLQETDFDAVDLKGEIDASSTELTLVAEYLKTLPQMINNQQQAIQTIVTEMRLVTESITEVKRISEQTSLLSLNATIEAARAGEYGTGFTVVAQEVRKLAQRSALAAENIQSRVAQFEQVIKRHFVAELAHDAQHKIQAAANLPAFIDNIYKNYADIRQFYKIMLTVVTAQNQHIADGLSNMLGNVQFQDVVMQQVDRLQQLYIDTGLVLQDLQQKDWDRQQLHEFIQQTQMLIAQFTQSDRHHHVESAGNRDAATLTVELF